LAAEQILRQVQVARADIKYKGGAGAIEHVQKGLELVKIINNALPEYDVTTTIKSGNATYKEEEKQKQSGIPVYGELDATFAMLPHVKTAKHEGAGNQSPEKSMGEAEVRDTRTFLDVRDANYYLEQAASNLQNNDLNQFREMDLPLVRARWSLMEAARMAIHNDYQGAKASLQEAVDQLESYKSEVGQAEAKTTQTMINDIRKVSNRLREQKEASAQTITGIWDKLANSF
jgi:hypothetical protein